MRLPRVRRPGSTAAHRGSWKCSWSFARNYLHVLLLPTNISDLLMLTALWCTASFAEQFQSKMGWARKLN
jgi:hypothetical protein